MPSKTASSQAAWSLIMEGVAAARVEVHRLQHLVVRATQLVEDSEQSEHIQQVAGDILLGVPRRINELERHLDRTSLALSKMGETFFSALLPFSDKTEVDEAVTPASAAKRKDVIARRVASRWMQEQ